MRFIKLSTNFSNFYFFLETKKVIKIPAPKPMKANAATCPVRIPTPIPINKQAGIDH
jgi:hypothetical protein